MVNPVPGKSITTPYGKRGSYWSCNEDANGNGIHTGVDYAAPSGTKVVAARPGKVVYCNHGSAFGSHQLEIVVDGTRDFYAHMRSRAVANGAKVDAGDKVGEVGAEGNVTGAHLHFERHKVASGGWSCGVIVDPQPSINYQPSGGGGSDQGDDVPQYITAVCNKDQKLEANQWVPIPWDSGTDDLVFPGNPGVDVSGPYVATLSVQLDTPDPGGYTMVSWVEWDLDTQEAAETSAPDSLGEVDNGMSTKVGTVAKGRRLRARVKHSKNDAKLVKAQLSIVTW